LDPDSDADRPLISQWLTHLLISIGMDSYSTIRNGK
jgi:hypothetical protein